MRIRFSDIRLSVREAEGEVDILHGLSFSLDEGSIVSVVGESGSGKTLLMKTISSGLDPQGPYRASGEIHWHDRRISLGGDESSHEYRAVDSPRFAMIYQDPKGFLNPSLRVGQHLEEILRYLPETRTCARVEELLEMVHLPYTRAFCRQFPHELSGGMQQRLVIACALASDPDILIADEALTALDSQTGNQILKVLRELVQGGRRSVLYISHDLKTVERAADRVMVMYAGYIVEDRSRHDFFQRPRHPYSRALMESHPALRDRGHALSEIPGEIPVAGMLPPGCPFAPRCPRKIGACSNFMPDPEICGSDSYRCYVPLVYSDSAHRGDAR